MGTVGNLIFLAIGVGGTIFVVKQVQAARKAGQALSGQPVPVPGGSVIWDPTSATSNIIVNGNQVEKEDPNDSWDQTGIVSLQKMVGDGLVELKAPGLIITPFVSQFRISKKNGMINVPSADNPFIHAEQISGKPQSAGIVFGITTNDIISGYSDIDYGFKLNDDGSLEVVENGSSIFDPDFKPGDDLKIINTGGQVRYVQNGTVIYTSLKPLNAGWRAAVSIFNNGQTVAGLKIQGTPAPLPLPLLQ